MEEDKSARPGSALDLLCEGSKSNAVLPPSGLSEMFLSGEGEAWELGRKSKIGWTLGGGEGCMTGQGGLNLPLLQCFCIDLSRNTF